MSENFQYDLKDSRDYKIRYEDGNAYLKCTFENCSIMACFKATKDWDEQFRDLLYHNTDWRLFSDAADLTIGNTVLGKIEISGQSCPDCTKKIQEPGKDLQVQNTIEGKLKDFPI